MNNIVFEKGNYRVYNMDGVYKVMAVQNGRTFKMGSSLNLDEAISFCKNLAVGANKK